MNIPLPTQKVDQQNFASYKDSREWLHRNNFKYKGMVMELPWKDYFVERFEKDGFVALAMNVTYFPHGNSLSLPLGLYEKPYQIDIATV